MFTYRGIETPIYHTSQVFVKCYTLCPGINVSISRRSHSVESSRELDGLVSGSELVTTVDI